MYPRKLATRRVANWPHVEARTGKRKRARRETGPVVACGNTAATGASCLNGGRWSPMGHTPLPFPRASAPPASESLPSDDGRGGDAAVGALAPELPEAAIGRLLVEASPAASLPRAAKVARASRLVARPPALAHPLGLRLLGWQRADSLRLRISAREARCPPSVPDERPRPVAVDDVVREALLHKVLPRGADPSSARESRRQLRGEVEEGGCLSAHVRRELHKVPPVRERRVEPLGALACRGGEGGWEPRRAAQDSLPPLSLCARSPVSSPSSAATGEPHSSW